MSMAWAVFSPCGRVSADVFLKPSGKGRGACGMMYPLCTFVDDTSYEPVPLRRVTAHWDLGVGYDCDWRSMECNLINVLHGK